MWVRRAGFAAVGGSGLLAGLAAISVGLARPAEAADAKAPPQDPFSPALNSLRFTQVMPDHVHPPGYPKPPADPHDLSGVWDNIHLDRQLRTVDDKLPPFQPWAMEAYRNSALAQQAGQPTADAPTRCLPPGVPRIMAISYPFQMLQTPGQITMVFEYNRNARFIYMDKPQPEDPDPTFMGSSAGHWEGDTLVVDTIALKTDGTTLDQTGMPHSDQLHVTERFRKINGGYTLEDRITIDDPKVFTKPWTAVKDYDWYPELRLLEYVCEENNRNPPGADGVTTTPTN